MSKPIIGKSSNILKEVSSLLKKKLVSDESSKNLLPYLTFLDILPSAPQPKILCRFGEGILAQVISQEIYIDMVTGELDIQSPDCAPEFLSSVPQLTGLSPFNMIITALDLVLLDVACDPQVTVYRGVQSICIIHKVNSNR